VMINQNKKENNEDLTIEKVKGFKGFENISDDEANDIALSIKQFSLLAYNYYKKFKKKN
jgi:hypothetical protein